MFRTFFLTILLLLLSAACIFWYKVDVLKFPLTPDETAQVWNVEGKVTFSVGTKKPVRVSLFIPHSTKEFSVMDEGFVSHGFGLATEVAEGNRKAVWSVREARGNATLFYKAVVRQIPAAEKEKPSKIKPEIPSPEFEGANLTAAQNIIDEASKKSADVETLTAQLIRSVQGVGYSGNVEILLGTRATERDKTILMTRLLWMAKIPARVVNGIKLNKKMSNPPIESWIEVWDGGFWHAHDPLTGQRGIAADYIPWWRGEEPLVKGTGLAKVSASLYVSGRNEEAIETALKSSQNVRSPFYDFSIFSLPLHSQMMFSLLFLVPLGAVVVAFMRNIIGIATFGTFMPVLLALAFKETELLMGITLFILLIGFGLIARAYLEHLRLLLVPRLTSILTIVVILMFSVALLTHLLGIDSGLAVGLFPMVIISMTIERLSITWEELGAGEAIKKAVGTLLVSVLVYLVIIQDILLHLLSVFPELLLIILALSLLLGRYTGYRLTELIRFKDLAGAGKR